MNAIKEKYKPLAYRSKNALFDMEQRSINNVFIKKGSTSSHIVSFFLQIFNIPESPLSESISKSVIDLDNLAKEIDTLIDGGTQKFIPQKKIANFIGLEEKIVDCFSHLINEPHLQSLIAETLNAVEESFVFNTHKRESIYNLTPQILNTNCTTYYLYPLFNHLAKRNEIKHDIKPIFALVSNYIQIFDDLIDVAEDLEFNIKTPLTEKYLRYKSSTNSQDRAFYFLATDVQSVLNDYLCVIEKEIFLMANPKITHKALREWHQFNSNMKSLLNKNGERKFKRDSYLRKVKKFAPAIVCYH